QLGIVELHRRPLGRVPRDRGLADLGQSPGDHFGLLRGSGDAVEAAEEKDRGADPGKNRQETDEGEEFQGCHGHVSGCEASACGDRSANGEWGKPVAAINMIDAAGLSWRRQSRKLPAALRRKGRRSNGDGDHKMAKAYWVACYHSISDPEALAAYAKLAAPAIAAGGGRFLARGTAAKAYEAGLLQRIVIIEFDSVERAAATHDSPAYQAALKVF